MTMLKEVWVPGLTGRPNPASTHACILRMTSLTSSSLFSGLQLDHRKAVLRHVDHPLKRLLALCESTRSTGPDAPARVFRDPQQDLSTLRKALSSGSCILRVYMVSWSYVTKRRHGPGLPVQKSEVDWSFGEPWSLPPSCPSGMCTRTPKETSSHEPRRWDQSLAKPNFYSSRSSAIRACTRCWRSSRLSLDFLYLSDSCFHSSLLFLGASLTYFLNGSSRMALWASV